MIHHYSLSILYKHYIETMQNRFESEDPSTLNFSESSQPQPPSFKLECNAVLIFIVLGFVFLIMAMIELITNYKEFDYQLPLDYDATNGKLISSTAYVSYMTDDTIAIYLDFKQITQVSFTNKFDGEDIQKFDEFADNCQAYRLNSETSKMFSITNTSLSPSSYSIPCGKYPSMFIGTDMYLITDNGTKIQPEFKGTRVFDYKVHDLNTSLQWTSLQHPLFQNWMEQNANINTKKLIGKAKGKFEGDIHLEIALANGLPLNLGPISARLTNNKSLGGFNYFLCLANFIQSAIMFIFAFLVYIYQKIMKEQIKNTSKVGERKIELRTNSQIQAGKSQL